jgi:hypothetical protein
MARCSRHSCGKAAARPPGRRRLRRCSRRGSDRGWPRIRRKGKASRRRSPRRRFGLRGTPPAYLRPCPLRLQARGKKTRGRCSTRKILHRRTLSKKPGPPGTLVPKESCRPQRSRRPRRHRCPGRWPKGKRRACAAPLAPDAPPLRTHPVTCGERIVACPLSPRALRLHAHRPIACATLGRSMIAPSELASVSHGPSVRADYGEKVRQLPVSPEPTHCTCGLAPGVGGAAS